MNEYVLVITHDGGGAAIYGLFEDINDHYVLIQDAILLSPTECGLHSKLANVGPQSGTVLNCTTPIELVRIPHTRVGAILTVSENARKAFLECYK